MFNIPHISEILGTIISEYCNNVTQWTRAKFEIATGEPFNPIKQDVKNGALRFLKCVFRGFRSLGRLGQTRNAISWHIIMFCMR